MIKCLIGTVVFTALAAVVVYLSKHIPDVDTGSKLFQHLYFRSMVNTTWFPLSQFVCFMCLNVLGWAFINVINSRP